MPFYRGDLAAQMADTAQALGSKHTLDDWADHHGQWVDPISTSYGPAQIHECPPNGGVYELALIAFAILDLSRPGRRA